MVQSAIALADRGPVARSVAEVAAGDLLELFGLVTDGRSAQGRDHPVAATVAALVSAGSASAQTAGGAHTLRPARPAALYPLHSDYVAAVARSAASGVRQGFLLPADALRIDAAAAGSVTGLPAPTG